LKTVKAAATIVLSVVVRDRKGTQRSGALAPKFVILGNLHITLYSDLCASNVVGQIVGVR
jgi:hypothetical protein